MQTWAHVHLPRLQSGDPQPVSLKIPGQRIAYAGFAVLEAVEFKVSEAGRQRCIREGVRNVHAWAVGRETDRGWGRIDRPVGWRTAVYDPFKGGSFVDAETLEPVTLVAWAILSGKDVWYLGYEARVGVCHCGATEGASMPDNHSIAVCAP